MRKVVLSTLLLFLSGCAEFKEMQRQYIIEKCTPVAAYNSGLSDGLTPDKMPDTNYASICPNNHYLLNQEYNRGFTEGLKARPQKIEVRKQIKIDK